MSNQLITTAYITRAIELELYRQYPRLQGERQARDTFSQLYNVPTRDVICDWVSDTSVQAREMTDAEKRERDFNDDQWVTKNDQSPCCPCRCHDEDY